MRLDEFEAMLREGRLVEADIRPGENVIEAAERVYRRDKWRARLARLRRAVRGGR